MKTDWNQIRRMMNAAIDTCEKIEKLGYTEQHRNLNAVVNGQKVSLHDFMVSAWTYPEIVRYQIIRQRHEKGVNLPYIPESARILTAMASACAELIGASEEAPAQDAIKNLTDWYANHLVSSLQQAIDPTD
ncbi:hypothetical protein [Herbaspirillum sp. RV1423]|uniref:hypothetical protein n=1 Tax=Herbaspirillum sp. RV1423 TaxID=1443993 RepID=UPI000550928F|nr:hypothetical protein [Herbaspirillum sp. RV1423]